MKFAAIALFLAAGLSAQTTPTAKVAPAAPANPLVATSQGMYAIVKNDINRSAAKITDELWSFKPSPDVRSFGQLFAHIADGQYEFCGVAAEGKSVDRGIEKSVNTRAGVLAALKDAFAYCDATYSKMTDASSAETATFFGRPVTKLGAMDFNIAHTFEHYGNLVTYMRLKGIVPPSSERGN